MEVNIIVGSLCSVMLRAEWSCKGNVFFVGYICDNVVVHKHTNEENIAISMQNSYILHI